MTLPAARPHDLVVTGLIPPEVALTGARRRLFEAALVLFGEHGYSAVSVRDLAQVTGLRPAALYAHVASKQQLLHELVLIGETALRSREHVALLDAGTDPADQVRALVRTGVLAHLTFPELARVSTRELGSLSPEQRDALLASRAGTAQTYAEILERGTAAGVFRVPDPFLAVKAIGAMGVQVAFWWTPASGPTAEQVADTYAGYALALLGAV